MNIRKIAGVAGLTAELAFGGYIAVGKFNKPTSASSENGGQVVRVQRGNMDVTISADGKVEAPYRQAKLSFESAGTVKELAVRAGADVKKGQVLARLDTINLERAIVDAEYNMKSAEKAMKDTHDFYDTAAIAQAEAAVASAQAQLKATEKAYQDVQSPYNLSPYTPSDIAAAEAALAAAQAQLKAAEKAYQDVQPPYNLSPYTPSDIASAEAAVAAAQSQVKDTTNALNKVLSPITNEDIAHLKVDVENAEKALAIAQQDLQTTKLNRDRNVGDTQELLRQEQEKYKPVIKMPLVGETMYLDPRIILGVDTISNNMETAYQSLLKARDNAKIAQETGDKNVASTQAAVDKAQNTLKKAKEALDRKIGDVPVDVAVKEFNLENAKASLIKAREDLKKRKAGPEPLEIANRQFALENAKASLIKAREDLKKRKAGPELLEIANRQAALENAKASLVKAQEDLKKKKAGPDSTELALRKAQLAAAKAALDKAQDSLTKATIVAPFDGIVASADNMKVWDRVGPDDTIVQIIDTREFEFQVFVDEMDIPGVVPGQAARISVDALPNSKITGEVIFVSPLPKVEAGVVRYEVKIAVKVPKDLGLRSGMSSSANVIVGQRDNVLVVPANAIVRNKSGRATARVIVNGREQERTVETGMGTGQSIEILSGLTEGDTVVAK